MNGMKHGEGTYTDAYGDKYVGEWRNNKRNGDGVLILADGRKKYVGEWEDGEFHGEGTYTWPSGSRCVGQFKNGELHGQAGCTGVNGTMYVGDWKDEKWHGQGTMTWASGRKYVGEWKYGEEHGHGTVTDTDGTKYVGEFKNRSRWEGAYYDKNGNVIATYSAGVKKLVNQHQTSVIKADIVRANKTTVEIDNWIRRQNE
jgi:hypothetical protein